MITFAIIVLIFCFAIWFWVGRSEKPKPETGTRRSAFVAPAVKGDAVKTDQVQDEKKLPAAATDEAVWKDRRSTEQWRDWLALTTTIIAVMTVGMTMQVSQYLTTSLISQGKETNAWSFYQVKSFKENTVTMAKAALELQLATASGISVEGAEKYRIMIKKYDDEIKRYRDEREEIQVQAEALGKTKGKTNQAAVDWNFALLFLQISIVLSAIATMLHKKYIWYVSLADIFGWLYFLIRGF